MNRSIISLVYLAFLLGLVSCGKNEKAPPAIRSIKYATVEKQATGQLRKFSGVIYAVDYSYISFDDVSGKVLTVNVDIGNKVKKGQILATLDKEKYQLDLKDAQANLKKAEAKQVKAKADYDRELELFKKKVSFKKRLDAMKYQLDASESEIKSANAKLGTAERNLRHTELKAPYNGYVGERLVEPKQQVRLGQKIFRIDAKGKLEVQFDIPESMRKRVELGDDGSVTFSGQPGLKTKCSVSFLGTAASRGNAFPVKAQLIDPPESVKPGMTAEVSLVLPVVGKTAAGFLLPIAAYLPGHDPKSGVVFVYDKNTSTVKKVAVKTGGSQGNLGIVIDGLKPGDIVATAGVSFLKDGMKVKLYKPKTKTGVQ